MNKIELDYGNLKLKAELFDTEIAAAFYNKLPKTVSLTHWGQEMYGSIGVDLGTESPVSEIPPGGLAYTNQGNYLCIFYGQNPAWSVEHIGRLTDGWEGKLSGGFKSVTISKK